MAKETTLPPDFKVLLNKPLDSFERPPSIPAGTYFGVLGAYQVGKSRFGTDRGTVIHIPVILTGPTEDVPVDELDESLLPKMKLKQEFTLDYKFNDFLEALGHNTAGKGADEFLHLLEGSEVLVTVSQTPGKNEKDKFNNVRRIVGAN
jgi:hypothetical protein